MEETKAIKISNSGLNCSGKSVAKPMRARKCQ